VLYLFTYIRKRKKAESVSDVRTPVLAAPATVRHVDVTKIGSDAILCKSDIYKERCISIGYAPLTIICGIGDEKSKVNCVKEMRICRIVIFAKMIIIIMRL